VIETSEKSLVPNRTLAPGSRLKCIFFLAFGISDYLLRARVGGLRKARNSSHGTVFQPMQWETTGRQSTTPRYKSGQHNDLFWQVVRAFRRIFSGSSDCTRADPLMQRMTSELPEKLPPPRGRGQTLQTRARETPLPRGRNSLLPPSSLLVWSAGGCFPPRSLYPLPRSISSWAVFRWGEKEEKKSHQSL